MDQRCYNMPACFLLHPSYLTAIKPDYNDWKCSSVRNKSCKFREANALNKVAALHDSDGKSG